MTWVGEEKGSRMSQNEVQSQGHTLALLTSALLHCHWHIIGVNVDFKDFGILWRRML